MATTTVGKTTPTDTTIIKPLRAGELGLGTELQELWQYRHLVKTLLERDLRIRYKNSILGIWWTLVPPILQVLVLTIAIGYIMGAGPKNLSAYLFCAMVPWTFFSTSVLDSSTAVLAKMALIKKVYFPREILVISNVCQNFVNCLITLSIFVLYRWVVTPIFVPAPGPPPLAVLWLPVIILLLFMYTLGTCFIVCTVNVFYEDVKFMATVMMQFVFYLLPILYFAENIMYARRIGNVHVRWWVYHLYLANPLVWLVTAFKQMFFQPSMIAIRGAPQQLSAPFDLRYLVINGILSIIVCIGGYAIFNRYKWRFAERP